MFSFGCLEVSGNILKSFAIANLKVTAISDVLQDYTDVINTSMKQGGHYGFKICKVTS